MVIQKGYLMYEERAIAARTGGRKEGSRWDIRNWQNLRLGTSGLQLCIDACRRFEEHATFQSFRFRTHFQNFMSLSQLQF